MWVSVIFITISMFFNQLGVSSDRSIKSLIGLYQIWWLRRLTMTYFQSKYLYLSVNSLCKINIPQCLVNRTNSKSQETCRDQTMLTKCSSRS